MMVNFINELADALKDKKGGLEKQLLMAPVFREDELLKRDPKLKSKESAVLALLNPFSEELSIIITKRSSRLNSHRGQVSFPGGKVDEEDKDTVDTALRETYEEVGIESKEVRIIGELSQLFIPPSNFDVAPIVGVLKNNPNYNINLDEVESVVEVPLIQLLDNSNIKEKSFFKSRNGEDRRAPYYDVMGLEIWGATAMIISEFVELIKDLDISVPNTK